jgi:flagellar biosynthesis protein
MKKTNPKRTKSAVSLRYDSLKNTAPKVTAKGKGLVAENIIALAHEHNIPVQQDPDLVEVLSQVDVDQEIPPAVYQVVAELLAFVYQMNKDYQKSN